MAEKLVLLTSCGDSENSLYIKDFKLIVTEKLIRGFNRVLKYIYFIFGSLSL